MSDIRRARERLMDLATTLPLPAARRIRRIIKDDLFRIRHRASAGTRVVHPTPKPAQVLAIRKYKQYHPDANDGDIGRRFGVVNHGRVSEILYGKKNRPVFDRKGKRIL